MDEARKKRAAALEEKKKRLEEIRKKRAEREVGGTVAGSDSLQDGPPGGADEVQDLNDYINSLLAAPSPTTSAPAQPPVDNFQSPPVPQAGGNEEEPPPPPKAPARLSVARGLGKVVVPPVAAAVCYHKGTQTEPSELGFEGGGLMLGPEAMGVPEKSPPTSAKRRSGGSRHVTYNFGPEDMAAVAADDSTALTSPRQPPEEMGLTEEEKEKIVAEPGFVEFVSRSSLIVERLLGRDEVFDVFVDYGAGGRERKRGEQESVTRLMRFSEDKRCAERPVMDVHWSPHYSELFLAAYNTTGGASGVIGADGVWGGISSPTTSASSASSGEPDGLVLLWSLAMPSRPEFSFTCPAPVLTARFHDHDSHVIIGGTYSGQIVVWDTRAKSLPVQRTPLSASGHTHPVYSLALAPAAGKVSGHTNVLVSASSDGRVCSWNLSQLNQPMDVAEVKFDAEKKAGSPRVLGSPTGQFSQRGARSIPITAFAFDSIKGSEELVLGSESGHLYTAALHKGGAAAGRGTPAAALVRQYEAHFGLVTSLARHPSSSKALSALLLSASVDWSMRLWNLSKSPEPLAVFHHGTYDYVCDVKWCPSHPAVFSSITAGGDLNLWNLNQSLEVPVTKAFAVAGPERPKRALTRLAWSSEGRKIAVGDASGCVHVLGVAEEVVKARMDEELRLETTLEHRGPAEGEEEEQVGGAEAGLEGTDSGAT